uniref:Putative ribonuclease H-like domain-containing protein n=1 Tax=Tanacetum cinerariifolium TaxID=118510 RepID=A0A699JMS8_TANCI|nr:putative ribonuclease H-like domain-containing protein [Tanacetum cinerariifolium]
MAFLSTPDSTNEVDTTTIQVSTISAHDNTANLSDATMYAFLSHQPNGSQLVHKDLEQIHKDDLEEIDLKWLLALLSMRAKREYRSPRSQESRPRNHDSSRKTVIMEDTSSKAMVAIDGAGFDWSYMIDDEVPTNMALMDFSDSATVQKPVLKTMEKETGQREVRPVWNNAMRVNHQNFSNSRRNFAPTAVLTKSGIVPISIASSKGGKITGKGKLRTGKLDFKDVYFVKEVKFNLFRVLQMCDKKNSVLFTETECLILSPDFKLPDENQVLLKVPKKNNMYSFNLKNVVPSEGLTCLFAKTTNDESNQWHRRLGHINFKTMNKLMKGNLVRGLPSNIFENDHICVACQKGKQHKSSSKKDETSGILKNFITGIENQLNHKVKIIRYDNRTEFKNYEMNRLCRIKGIKREFSNARTPQH